jgi:hypothetical protein
LNTTKLKSAKANCSSSKKLGGVRSELGQESTSDQAGSLSCGVTNSENWAVDGKLNTGGALYGLAQELIGGFHLERRF